MRFSKGTIIIAASALVGFICFFVPWTSGFYGRMSGAGLLDNWGATFLVLVAFLGAIGVLAAWFLQRLSLKFASWAVIVMAAYALIVVFSIIGIDGLSTGAGLWLSFLAVLGLLAGAGLNLYEKAA